MSSGSIDAQERSELEAAEKGIRLTRPAGYTRQTRFTWLTPEQIARESPIMLDHWQRLEDEHQRTHQATVEYLQRKALGERVSRQQLADEYGVTVHMIRWRLRLYRGYDTTKKEAEYRRRKDEREAQIRESGMYAPALLYDHFIAELAREAHDLEMLLPEPNAMEAYHQANEILCNIIALFATQINRDELTNVLSDIVQSYGKIMSRMGREGPGLILIITPGLRSIRYTPAQKHEYFMQQIELRAQHMVDWMNEADVWQAYFQASDELCHLVSLLTFQLQDDVAADAGKGVTLAFEAIAE